MTTPTDTTAGPLPGTEPGGGPAAVRRTVRRSSRRDATPRGVALAQQLGALVVVLVAWHLFASVGPGKHAGLPTPAKTVTTTLEVWSAGTYWSAIGSTVVTMLIGFVISAVIGIPVGFLIGSFRRTRLSTQFLVDFGRTIPGVALLPLLLLTLGNTRQMATTLVVFGCIWVFIVQATYAVQQVSPQLRQVATSFRISPVERFRFIFAPSVLPFLMTGLRIAASISLIMTITAEYLGQTGGVGFQLQQMQQISDAPRLFVYMFTAATLGVLANVVLVAVQRRALWWHASERGGAR